MDPITVAQSALEAYLFLRNLGYKEEDSKSQRRMVLSQIMNRADRGQIFQALNSLAMYHEFPRKKYRIFIDDIDWMRHLKLGPIRKLYAATSNKSKRFHTRRPRGRKRKLTDKLLEGY